MLFRIEKQFVGTDQRERTTPRSVSYREMDEVLYDKSITCRFLLTLMISLQYVNHEIPGSVSHDVTIRDDRMLVYCFKDA